MAKFAHRSNSDSTTDSICLRCFRTAATVSRGVDSSLLEARHVCVAGEIPGENRHYAVAKELVEARPSITAAVGSIRVVDPRFHLV
jgi:hypothetical protein